MTPASWVSWGLLGVGMVLGFVLWRTFQSTMLVPTGWDAMHHGYFIEQITRFHTMKPSIVLASDPTSQDGSGSFYPLAFNLVAATLHTVTGGSTSTLMLASTMALAGVLLPLGSFALARELDGDRPLVAGFSAITPVLPLLLYMIEGTGRLTGILGVALVPGLVLLLMAPARATTVPLAIVGIVGMVGMHTSEVPVAIVMAAACVLFTHGAGALRRWLVWVVVAGAVAAIAMVMLEPNVLHMASQRHGAIIRPATRPLGEALDGLLSSVGQAWVVPFAGCLLTVLPRWRRYRGAALTLGIFALFYIVVAIGIKTLVPALATPWYGAPGRISWGITVLAAIPAAVALAALGEAAGPVARYIGGRWTGPALAAVVGGLVIVAFLLPPVARQGRLTTQIAGPVNADSMAAFRYLARHVAPGEPVLDDARTDGAMWMYIDEGVRPLFGNAPLLGDAPHSWLEKLWLAHNLHRINKDPCVRTLLDQFNVHYVYVGGRRMFDGWAHFVPAAMTATRSFTEVFHSGKVRVYAINPAPPPGSCTQDVTTHVRYG